MVVAVSVNGKVRKKFAKTKFLMLSENCRQSGNTALDIQILRTTC